METLDSNARFCGGALWDIDGGLRRQDLQTGEVTRPTGGDHGTGFACIDDAWLLDEHGHRIDADGTLVELPDIGDIRRIVGQTDDGRAIVYLYGEQLVLVDRDGGVAPGVPVVDTPEKVLLHDGVFHALADNVDDVVWHIGADGGCRIRPTPRGKGWAPERPWERSSCGTARRGRGGGRRLFPLGAPSGPVDSTYERFFFDADELYLCHGRVCEARRLDALDGDVRQVQLPDGFSDESKLSPHARYLGQYDTQHLYRTTLDTGEVHAQPVSEWVDDLSVDAAGHIRWRLSQDEDEDDLYGSVGRRRLGRPGS